MTSDHPQAGRRRGLRIALGLVLVLVATCGVGFATMDRWLFVVLDPGDFDPSATPPAPDYTQPSAWAALPAVDDGADVFLPAYPAIDQATAPADVFYVHPTTAVAGTWNAPYDDPTTIEATHRGGTLIQASVFNACCAVYAPRYRQANGRAFTFPDADGEAARDVAYGDVSAAFDEFLARTGERPFVIAGHSQGAVLAARLVRERIAGTALAARFVVAYLPGAPVRADAIGVPICERPAQFGCVTSWHARGPGFEPNDLEFEADRPDTMQGRVCVNPITWTTDGAHAPADQNAGAIFFDTPEPAVKPAFADAQCRDGMLVITQMGDPERDLPSRVLLWLMGPENYHPIEYQLYYLDIRRNAVDRVESFVAG